MCAGGLVWASCGRCADAMAVPWRSGKHDRCAMFAQMACEACGWMINAQIPNVATPATLFDGFVPSKCAKETSVTNDVLAWSFICLFLRLGLRSSLSFLCELGRSSARLEQTRRRLLGCRRRQGRRTDRKNLCAPSAGSLGSGAMVPTPLLKGLIFVWGVISMITSTCAISITHAFDVAREAHFSAPQIVWHTVVGAGTLEDVSNAQ